MYIYFKISFNFFQLWVIQTFLSLIYFWQFFKMSLTEPQYGCHFTKLHKQTVDYHPTLLSNQQTNLVKAVNKIWRISPAFALIVSYIRFYIRESFPGSYGSCCSCSIIAIKKKRVLLRSFFSATNTPQYHIALQCWDTTPCWAH